MKKKGIECVCTGYASDEDEVDEDNEQTMSEETGTGGKIAGEKLYVVYAVNVLRRNIHTMQPLSGIAYENDMYFVIPGPNLKKARHDNTIASTTSIGLRYGAYALDENWCGSGNEVEARVRVRVLGLFGN